MKRLRLITGLVLALAGICCALGLWLWHSDLGQFKPQLTAQLTQRLQREVLIDGPLSIRLGTTVVVKAEKLKVANPDWAQQRWLVSSEALELQLPLRSLFRGPVIIESLQLQGLNLAAERAEDGRESWAFTTAAPAAAEPEKNRGVVVRHLVLNEAQFEYLPGSAGKPLSLGVDEFMQTQGPDGMLTLKLRGRLNQQTLEYTGSLGPFARLAEGADVQFDGAGRLGSLSISGSGNIDDLQAPRLPSFSGTLQGTSLKELEQYLPATDLPATAFHASLELAPDEQRLAVSLEAQAESLALKVNGSSRELLAVDDLAYTVDINGEHLAAWASLFGQQGLPDAPFSVSGRFERQGPRVSFEQVQATVGKAQLMLDGEIADIHKPRNSRLDLQLSGPEIAYFQNLPAVLKRSQGPFSATLAVQPGNDGPDTFEASINLAAINASATGRFGPGPAYAGTRIRLQAGGPEFSDLARLLKLDALPGGEYQLDAQLGIGDGQLELGPGTVLKLAENQLAAEGNISWSSSRPAAQLQLSLTGTHLQTITAPYLEMAIPAGAFALSGRYQAGVGQQRFEALEFDFMGVQGSGELVLDAPYDGSTLQFSLQAQGTDVRTLLPAAKYEKLLSNAFSARLEGAAKAGVWSFTDSELRLGPASLELDGTLGRLPDLSATRLDLRFSTPRLDALLRLPEGPLTATPVNLTTHFTGSPKIFELRDLSLQTGQSDIQGSGSVSLAEQPPRLDLALHSSMLDLSMTQSVQPGDSTGAQPVAATDERAIPDIVFPMELLQRVNARFRLSADQLRTPLDVINAATLNGALEDGALHIEQLRGEGIKGFANGSLSLVPGLNRPPILSAELAVKNMVLNLSRDLDQGGAGFPEVDVELQAHGQGADLRSVAASLNGHLYAQGGAGVIPNSVLGLLDAGLIMQIIRAVIPVRSQNEDTQLRCFATRLEFVDGRITAAPGAAIITERIHLVSSGSIDLASETLNLSIKATPAKAHQANVSEVLINPFVKIGGTIKNPQMELDAERALIFGGAAAATAGLSILATGLFNRLKTAKDPCAEYLRSPE